METRVPEMLWCNPTIRTTRTRRRLSHRDWVKLGAEWKHKEETHKPGTISTHIYLFYIWGPDIAEVFDCIRAMSVIQQQLHFRHTGKHPSTVIFEAPREAKKEMLLPGTSECCRLTSARKCLNRVLFKPRENAVKTHKTPLTNVRGGKSLYN